MTIRRPSVAVAGRVKDNGPFDCVTSLVSIRVGALEGTASETLMVWELIEVPAELDAVRVTVFAPGVL